MKAVPLIAPVTLLALLLIVSGCTQPSSTIISPTTVPVVYIVYASEKGDLSYTDAAYTGLRAAQEEMAFTVREFTLRDHETIPGLLKNARDMEKPGLIITIGFQYTNFTRQLAEAHPDIRILAIDQSGIGTGNVSAYEIVSYGDSYLSGVLAASATKTGRVGIIMGMKTELLDTFLRGYADGVRAVNSSITVDHTYVQQNSPAGFTDPEEAGRIAEGMYRNGTDVIYTCAGISNMGAFNAANTTTGRYVIGTDSDQSPLGPAFVLGSAIKRVDRLVYTGIAEHLNGSFSGGERVAGLKEGATGIVYNPAFASYTKTVSAWEEQAQAGEEKYLASRNLPGHI
ncbi:MAG: BMP family ABC transporter substrate-binding protein [Methanoregula sp.]|jgi:basic membrane protein A|nr:BMP family ABC transporter substrate-binding protein [Methanoregula sp.]